MVCRVTKYALFLPTREDAIITDFTKLFFKAVKCRFRTLRGVVSNKDSKLTSDFWREVCEIKMIKRRMSITHHPQTNSQSEALNKIIKDYLRAYSSEDQTV